MTTNYVQALTLYQAGAGNIIGATAVVLTNLTDIYGNAITTMAPFGSIGYITLEPDTTNEEAAIFTGLTVNSNGTVSLTGVSTILAQTPYTATSGLVRQHSGGTKVVITDNVAFWNTFANTNNINTFSQIQTFSVPPISSTTPVNNTDVPNKAYVDGVAVAGAPNANATTKGIVQLPTQAQVDAKTATGSTGAALALISALQRSTLLSDYVADTGTANTYAIAPSPAITAYTVGQIFSFKAVNANTGASTLNVNALGVKTIKKAGGATDLASGDIAAGMVMLVEYDGTNLIMLNPVAPIAASQTYANSLRFAGTGSDSSAILDGTTTVAWASKSGSTYTMTRDANLVSLTINGGVVLETANYKLYGSGTLNNAGTIRNTAANGAVGIVATGGLGGVNSTAGTLGIGGSGGQGGNPSASNFPGLTGSTASHALGGSGAIAGVGSASTAGPAGLVTAPNVLPNLLQSLYMVDSSTAGIFTYLGGGGGGGGGGGTNSVGNYGSGGGAGGNIVFISFSIVSNTGTISAIGGAGAAGGFSGGGGGGGGGGSIVIVTTSHTNSGSELVTGGAGGAGGGGGGLAGSTGSTGNVYIVTVSNL